MAITTTGPVSGYRATLYKHTTTIAHVAGSVATVAGASAANRLGTVRQVPTAGNQQDIANLPKAGYKFIGALPTTISDNTSTFSVNLSFDIANQLGLLTDDGTTAYTWMIVYGGNDVNSTTTVPTSGYVAFFDGYVGGVNVTSDLSDVIQAEIKVARTTQFDFIATA